jgi:plasmid stability protein
MMAKERTMMVRMSEELHKAVRVRAAELGRPISEIVRALLTAWVTDKIELSELQEPEQED